VGDQWLVISLILVVRLLRSLLLGHFILRLLGSLLLVRSEIRPRSVHLLLALVVQNLKKGLLSVSGGPSALQTKIMIKYIK
jgi:hypothetical protein